MRSTTLALASLATLALAKTDYEGCTSTQTVAFGGASMLYWDPTNGEICAPLDCGGGRAPPKTTVPGCPSYEGTAVYQPSFLPGWAEATASAAATASSAVDAAQGYPTASEADAASSPGYTTTEVAIPTSEDVYPSASVVAPSATEHTTLITSAPVAVLPSGTGGLYPTGSNGTAIESATLTASGGPVEQTGAAGVVGARQAVVGLVAGVFGLALL